MPKAMISKYTLASLVFAVLVATACNQSVGTPSPAAVPAPTAMPTVLPRPANPDIIMASTTSTRDSGLMDVLLPIFYRKTGYKVKAIYVGSGAAMTYGERGDADVLLVHAPGSEVTFMQAGHGVNRRLVMHNDFMIVGPSSDPAGIRGVKLATDAFKKLAASKSLFISRSDNSGTNQLELKVWKTVSIDPNGQSWYQETGQGMGDTLNIASQKQGYTVTDRAAYLATQKNLSLSILVQGDPILLNIYHVIQVNPNKSSRINAEGAKAFSDFIVSADTQKIVASFGVDKYGQALFFPDAGKSEADLGSR